MSDAEFQPAELTTVPDEFVAAMVISALEEENIDVHSVGDFTTSFPWESRKVRIMVRQTELERARQVLEAIRSQIDEEQLQDNPSERSQHQLSHFDEAGASRMVDVGQKLPTLRLARASAVVEMKPETRQLILDRELGKGDVLEVARLAGIMAAKRTAELIPLCHPLALDSVRVEFVPVDQDQLHIEATVEVEAKTGVEMEALTAVSIAALTVYDMCKAVDRGMRIVSTQLEEKRGGKSGHFQRFED